MTPKTLYKILSVENWEKSQGRELLVLPDFDRPFIHFALEEQLPRILDKYWKDASEYYLLTIDVSKLKGKLVFESNPGGSAKYYHLYDGSIPLSAVAEARRVNFRRFPG